MSNVGREKTYRIPMRGWGVDYSTLKEMYDNVRSGKEGLLSAKVIDPDTIEIKTIILRGLTN